MTAAAASSFAHESQELAVELHSILLDLDPARWRDDLAEGARRRLAALHARIHELVEAAANDARVAALRTHLGEAARLIRGVRADVEDDADAPDSVEIAASREELISLRERLQPAYENLAAALRAYAIHVPSLRPTNYARNVLHVGTAAVAITIGLLLPSMAWGTAITAVLATTCWSLEITRRIWPQWNEILMAQLGIFAHPHETHRVNSATWFVTALLLLTLPDSLPLFCIALAVLGLGDPAAALIGRRFGRITLIHGRSLEGSLTFVAFGTLAAFLVGLGVTSLAAPTLLAVSAGAAGVGAVVELLSHRIDDNLSVPLAAAAGATLVASLLGIVV